MTRQSGALIFAAAFALSLMFGCGAKDLTAPKAKAQEAPASQTRAPGEITIAAVGDIMLGSTSINDTFLPPSDGREMLKEVTPVLSAADITFGNLEGPMLEGGKSEKCAPPKSPSPADAYATPTPTPTPSESPKPGEKKPPVCFAFRVPTRYGQYLKDAGF